MRRLALAAVTAAALVSLLPTAASTRPDATRLTLKQATAIALRALKPGRGVVVFALPKPIGARARVGEASGKRTPAGRKAWLFWADQAPFALFQHSSRLVLVDEGTGRVIRNQVMRWWPVVDRRLPVFLTSRRDYAGGRYRVFPAKAARRVSTVQRVPQRAGSAAIIPPKAFSEDCVVMVGAYADWRFADNFENLRKLAGRYGMKSYTTPAGDSLYPNINDVTKQVELAAKNGCKDVFIYIAGHGSGPVPGRPDPFGDGGTFKGNYGDVPGLSIPSVSMIPVAGGKAPPASEIPLEHRISTSDFRGLFRNFSGISGGLSLSFKLLVDACYSGRFVNDLDKKKPENLLIVVSSVSADRTAFTQLFARADQNGNPTSAGGKDVPIGQDVFVNGQYTRRVVYVDIPEGHRTGGTEFTGGFVKAFDAFAKSDAQVDDAVAASQATGLPLLVYAIRDAWSTSGRFGDLAFTSGLTKPRIGFTEPQGNRSPVVEVFTAGRGGTKTFYEVTATDPEKQSLTYAWTNSNKCGSFTATGKDAEWDHPHSALPGGCPNEPVHSGTVTVVVSDGVWKCTVPYTAGSAAGRLDNSPAVCRK